jgi:hypothetical protein
MFAGKPGYPARCIFRESSLTDGRTSRRIGGLLLVLGMLFLLDIVTTQIILFQGGVEMNPFMAGIVASPALHLIIKAAILLLIFSVSIIAEQQVKGSSAVFYCVLITLYLFVFINNMFVILPRLHG